MTAKPLFVALILMWLAALPVAGQTTQPAPESISASTRPAIAPNPLASPIGAVEYLLRLTKADDFETIHGVNLQQATVSELRDEYAPLTRRFRAGYTMPVVDSKESGTVTSVICSSDDKTGKRRAVFSVYAIKRFDDWKVEISSPNFRRLSPGEREAVMKLNDWRLKRLAELHPTTQPATTTAASTTSSG